MDTDAASLIWFVGLGFVVPALLVVRAFRSPTRRQLARWADAAGVVITPTNEAAIRRHLGRARRFRSVAAFPFWWLALAPTISADFPRWPATPLVGLTAYVLGSMVAELWAPKAALAERRQAALVARSVDDYEPAWVRALPWMLVALSALLVSTGSSGDADAPTFDTVASLGAAAVVTALAALVARRIAARPQPGADPDLLAADDGLRATGTASCRAGAALLGIGALTEATSFAAPDGGFWVFGHVLVTFVAMGTWFAMLTVIVRQETWGHRRRFRQSASVTYVAPSPTGAPPTAPRVT